MADSIINSGNIKILTGTISIPDGRETSQTKELDFSGKIPSSAIFISISLSEYPLPYYAYASPGAAKTYVYQYWQDTQKLYINSSTSAWNGYQYKAIFYVPN